MIIYWKLKMCDGDSTWKCTKASKKKRMKKKGETRKLKCHSTDWFAECCLFCITILSAERNFFFIFGAKFSLHLNFKLRFLLIPSICTFYRILLCWRWDKEIFRSAFIIVAIVANNTKTKKFLSFMRKL